MGTIDENGGRRVTLKDIAKRLDVSHATVSRALNRADDPLISEATRLRVQKLADELGYRPNLAARNLATGRTGLLALWLWSEALPNAYHSHVSQLMVAEAQRSSYQLLINRVGWDSLRTDRRTHFDAWHVDGVIAHEAGPAIQARFPNPRKLPVPVVSTGAYHFLQGVDHVWIDVRSGAIEAIEHLLFGGRRRIAYVAECLEERRTDPRCLVHGELLDAAALPKLFLEVPGDRAGMRQAVREAFEQGFPADALFCHNDDVAVAAYRGLCDVGVRVPDDVAIVGCDGIQDTEYLEVPLSTIAQPLEEMCALARQFLERRIEDPTRPLQEAWLPAKLTIRPSSGIYRP